MPQYVTSHQDELSSAIPLWVGAMSTGNGFGHLEFCVLVTG